VKQRPEAIRLGTDINSNMEGSFLHYRRTARKLREGRRKQETDNRN
jgi:hypothetical protein